MPDAAFPSCFGEYGVQVADSSLGSRMAQNLVTCLYQTKLAGQCRLVTITWCKNLMGQNLNVTVDDGQYVCKVEMRPWFFWKRQGSKSFDVAERKVEVFWDLSTAKYSCGGPEPQESFYVAIVAEKEVVLLLGDMGKEAYKKIRARPASIEATLLSRREHLFGKKYFTTKAQFCEGGGTHEVMIECPTTISGSSSSSSSREPKLCIRVDRKVVVQVKRLVWKFRGNQTIVIDGQPVEVFWDVHNWLFNPSSGQAVFMFQMCSSTNDKPWLKQQQPLLSSSSHQWPGCGYSLSNSKEREPQSPAGFSLFLYAWKNE